MFNTRRVRRIEDDLDGDQAWVTAGLAELEQLLLKWACFEEYCAAQPHEPADPA